jgi:hypothetical protein
VPKGRLVIEQTPIPDSNGEERGVVAEGAVGSRWAGRFRNFRYELRRWRDGVIPDVAEAVESPRRLSDDPEQARRLLSARAVRANARVGTRSVARGRDVELEFRYRVAGRPGRPRSGRRFSRQPVAAPRAGPPASWSRGSKKHRTELIAVVLLVTFPQASRLVPGPASADCRCTVVRTSSRPGRVRLPPPCAPGARSSRGTPSCARARSFR